MAKSQVEIETGYPLQSEGALGGPTGTRLMASFLAMLLIL